ncbi:MAG: ATP-binding cassette domain-containing protein [Actinomycetes bacterium]|jgi:ABC-type oligopeptide transport system ATPase subunit|nr:ABC transporter ATP-binding protein [Acidimicrobiia bacterium]
MLEFDSVTKEFRVGAFGRLTITAVDDVSFRIAPGEIVSLIGESGSGKSTIGRMILRLTPATKGTIRFDGVDVSTLGRKELKEYYRHVQGVFQDPFSSFNPVFKADRVFEMLRSQFYPDRSGSEWEDRVAKAVEDVGLNPVQVLNRYPHQLSGGQLQRMLLARALLLDLRLLVADEVISMLDASTRVGVLNLLAELRERGLSILFITHDLALGYYISDRTIILRRGSIVEMGDTRRVFQDPRHPYTQTLLASVPQMEWRWRDRPVSAAVPVDGDGTGDAEPVTVLEEVEPGHWVAVS